MRRDKRNEDAVSPVIGVMLLLVVTVVIAAVVVGFSTGLAGSTGTTPTALFEVSYTGTWNSIYGTELANVGFKHKGGDAIPLKDLQITLESKGGSNSGIVLTHQASDTKTKDDMVVGEYKVSDKDQEQFNFWKSQIDYNSNTIKNYVSDPEDINDILTWDKSDPRWNTLEINMDDYDPDWYDDEEEYRDEVLYEIQYASTTSKKYVEFIKNAGWSIEEGPTPKASGGDEYEMSVLGQGKPTESTVSTGDIIHVVSYEDGNSLSSIYGGTGVKWTVSDVRTTGVIGKGEFVVGA